MLDINVVCLCCFLHKLVQKGEEAENNEGENVGGRENDPGESEHRRGEMQVSKDLIRRRNETL